jgi:hypothetical protein
LVNNKNFQLRLAKKGGTMKSECIATLKAGAGAAAMTGLMAGICWATSSPNQFVMYLGFGIPLTFLVTFGTVTVPLFNRWIKERRELRSAALLMGSLGVICFTMTVGLTHSLNLSHRLYYGVGHEQCVERPAFHH